MCLDRKYVIRSDSGGASVEVELEILAIRVVLQPSEQLENLNACGPGMRSS
jgi:hypothetical protein